jgi:hypothetical protein
MICRYEKMDGVVVSRSEGNYFRERKVISFEKEAFALF